MFEETVFDVIERPVFRRELLPDVDPITKQHVYRMEEVPGYKQIINASTNQTLSIMSKDYVPIRDVDVLNQALEIFDAANIDVIPIAHHVTVSKDKVVWRTTFMEVELPQYTIWPGEAEEHRVRIIIPNSFNGTSQLRLTLMLWRLVCQNGAMGWANDFNIALRHRKGIQERLGEALQLYVADHITVCQTKIKTLGEINGVYDRVSVYLQNNRILPGERWAERLVGMWIHAGTPVNFWELYNLFTSAITHSYGRNYGSKLNKFELLNKEVENIWTRVLMPH